MAAAMAVAMAAAARVMAAAAKTAKAAWARVEASAAAAARAAAAVAKEAGAAVGRAMAEARGLLPFYANLVPCTLLPSYAKMPSLLPYPHPMGEGVPPIGQVGVYTAFVQSSVSNLRIKSLSLSSVKRYHARRLTHRVTVPGSTAVRRPMRVALAAATHVLANAPGNAHSARPPAAQRRTSFLSHSALSAVSLATASAFSLAVSSARSASSRPTAAACVCAARTAHDWTKA